MLNDNYSQNVSDNRAFERGGVITIWMDNYTTHIKIKACRALYNIYNVRICARAYEKES